VAQPEDPDALFAAAVSRYRDGSVASAIELFQRAAAQRHVKAMSSLGIIAWNRGEFSVALEWLQKAAELGNKRASHGLAIMYWNGQGVAQDPAKAVEHMRAAAESRDDEVIAEAMRKAHQCTKDLPNANPALPGHGGITFRNDGRCVTLRYNPNAIYFEGERP
jgi:TPR repeat protein